jgi:hypothetical protein
MSVDIRNLKVVALDDRSINRSGRRDYGEVQGIADAKMYCVTASRKWRPYIPVQRARRCLTKVVCTPAGHSHFSGRGLRPMP